MREPLTVLIPTYNEEDSIRECLESVKWADEIFVVDSFSTDTTLDICREYTDRIVQHEYVNSATQKNWAIPQASHQWVMIVDSDERVDEQLRGSIRKALDDPSGYDGFYVKRETFFLDKLIEHGGWHKEYILRLFNRKRGRYQDKNVHACVEVDGATGYLEGTLYHHTYADLDDYFEKFLRYTKWAAGDLKKGSRRASWVNLAVRPWMRFLKMYVLRRGFLDGKHGLVLSYLAAFSVFTKYARLWEMDTGKAGEETVETLPPRRSTGNGAQPQDVRGKS
jgi:glycosyltransferase involved in cell wall biosynthesis